MSTKELWDSRFAKGQTYTPITEEHLDAVLARAGEPKNALDIACGTGDLVLKLARRGLTVTGTDISPVALTKARETLAAEQLAAQLVEADFDAPDFAATLGGQFDIVFMRLAFAFPEDRDAVLEQVRQLLRPGGTFVCILPGLLPTGEYNDLQRRISLPKDELVVTLKQHFTTVELLAEDPIADKPDWLLLTYVCRV